MRLVDYVRLTPSRKSEIPARVSAETGLYRLRKTRKMVAFQSSIERGFVRLCDFANEVQHIAWEPFSIEFTDLVDNRTRTYTPDYLVEINDREGQRYRYVVEVKERREAGRLVEAGGASVRGRAHIAMMHWCREQGDCSFLLATDDTIAAKGLANAKAISDRATYTPDGDLADLILSGGLGDFPATLGSTIYHGDRFGFARGEIISTVLHLCAWDKLWFDITDEWSDDTVLDRGPRRRVFVR